MRISLLFAVGSTAVSCSSLFMKAMASALLSLAVAYPVRSRRHVPDVEQESLFFGAHLTDDDAQWINIADFDRHEEGDYVESSLRGTRHNTRHSNTGHSNTGHRKSLHKYTLEEDDEEAQEKDTAEPEYDADFLESKFRDTQDNSPYAKPYPWYIE